MDANQRFLRDIEEFLVEQQMTAYRFGVLALGDSKFVPRIRAGRKPHLDTAEAVRAFMAAHRRKAVA